MDTGENGEGAEEDDELLDLESEDEASMQVVSWRKWLDQLDQLDTNGGIG